MATNDFLPFSYDGAALNYTNAEYLAHTQRPIGNQIGIADPKLVNKALRQASIMSAVLAQYVSDITGANSVDDGTTATLLTNLKTATSISSNTHAATSKSVPADLDELPILDSTASFVLKKFTWANIKTALTSLFAPVASPSFTGTPTAPTATAGTSTTQIATTAFAKTEITSVFTGGNASLSANGYQRLPSGLIMQWGSATIGSNQGATVVITLPTPFPTAFVTVSHMYTNGSAGAANTLMANAITLSNFTVTNQDLNDYGTGTEFRWFAIGY